MIYKDKNGRKKVLHNLDLRLTSGVKERPCQRPNMGKEVRRDKRKPAKAGYRSAENFAAVTRVDWAPIRNRKNSLRDFWSGRHASCRQVRILSAAPFSVCH